MKKSYVEQENKALNTSKRVVILTSFLILILLVSQSFSASNIHQSYQESLMDSVTDRILSDYQEYFTQLRLEIDLFQQKQLNAIEQLEQKAEQASQQNYMQVLTSLRSDIENTRLFALIDQNGQGSLKHITGNFLPDCESEIATTIADGMQKKLFLHRSKSSIHFDLLQPLATNSGEGAFFFVAFNPDILINLLKKYQLPHQQLFLMRADTPGEVELTTETNNNNKYGELISLGELKSFNFVKQIPNTRWQLAIRLSPQYSSNLYRQGLIKAVLIWLLLSLFIYGFFRQQKHSLQKQLQVEKALAYVDNYDQLTGLANRVNFDRQLSEHIEVNRLLAHNSINANTIVSNKVGVVMHIDLDKFQVINNSVSYALGDKFLHQISMSLKEFLPDNAIISRLGNDEFAVLLPDLLFSEAKAFAHKIRLLIQKIRIAEYHQDTNITASIGVIILDHSIFDAQQVYSSLGQAVSLAKEKGRNRVQVYQSDDEQLVLHAKEMEAVHDVAEALKENRLLLYRQEIKSLSQENSSHYEVLVRMKNSKGMLVPPNHFIPAAEKYGSIRQIDQWVIENTFKMLALSPEDNTRYSINLSGVTIADRDIYDQVVSLFEQYRIPAKRICFEITETSAISHLDSALHFIHKMKIFGCQFSLDDFGSGLSSFSYLQKLPVDIIKIDGAFVQDMDTNPINRIFVENIKRTAEAMNKKTIAEFVENAVIEKMLTEIGIDYGQGYHIHKPELWFEARE
ncbi:putative bifunctional diguanylate cyclase/phosphodiesterase [Colwellia psychrerythraea]|uniref:Diguanylate cyclase/phosphodiesterase n=1 Tax=Colwellia psychrerythraea TaxID=28229 RepID=A0A099KGE8_COLPS|nr:EAL domain-containing protein [Colwellia psychrerythraea]KGJ89067.1 diguanylate cyclase/phosphodiesterase [Colwellia psychrerythraea]